MRLLPASVVIAACLLGIARPAAAQGAGRGAGPGTPRDAAPVDLTGYWVSVITEDWKFRMVLPAKGVYETLPLNAAGRKVGDAWDPAKDEAAGEQCRGYGAASIMRMPGRLHVTWSDASTLQIETDEGTQIRRLHFDRGVLPPGEPSWQGHSLALWQYGPGGRGQATRGGNLKVVTSNLRAGYIRRNGAPYSNRTTVTEYFDVHELPNGDRWLTVTTKVDDPVYFTRPLLTSSDFKKLPNGAGWSPTPCTVR